MKILAFRQPWASLIVIGGKNTETGVVEFKDVENRTWATTYRGPLLVHASARPDDVNDDQLAARYHVRTSGKLPVGGIIGITEIVDVVRPHASKWYNGVDFAFVLRNSRPLPFTPWKGIQSMQNPT